jgi:predicted adenine nucleotide alpha hydrolase (AANH) superfamily ATPase
VAVALKQEGFSVTGYFFNPNIHPYAEHQKREEAAKEWARQADVSITVVEGYQLEEWFAAVSQDLSDRCKNCYALRLLSTAQAAREQGFDFFSTTLLISPYQRHEQVREAGEEAAASAGVPFYYVDFRPLFRNTYSLARNMNLYRQNYCGCVFSDYEGVRRRQSKKHESHM